MPIENVRYVLIQLVSVISQGLMESGVNLRAIFGPEFNLFRELERRKTLGDIETWMVEMLKQIGARQQSPSPERTELISHALTRIRSRYAEQISLSTIADELGVSPEHLSRRFKAETGERYVELVNRLRLEKARELVVNTDWTLDVVAKESGFSNYQYLIRRYKHRFGVTPARHRETRSAKKNTDDTIS
jgi:AraC-like DNA-binding protein